MDDVVAQIRSAFPRVVIQADDAFASWGRTYLDAESYQRALTGKRWDELDRAYLERRSDALGFLGTQQLAAVLPAYLELLLEGDLDSQVPEMLMLIVAPPSASEHGLGVVRFDALVAALAAPQRAAVAASLRWFADHHPGTSLGRAAGRLDAAWGRLSEREE